MDQEDSGAKKSLKDRFPNMEPLSGGAPSMTTINGIGARLYGNRDYDHESGTYVKTYCFCFLFIPLLALGAYRVADAERGWYFFGKEPLSKFARGWNWSMLGLVILLFCGIGVESYTSSPAYQARQKIAKADTYLKQGDALRAVAIYQTLVNGAEQNAKARAGLQKGLEMALQSDSAGQVSAAMRIVAGLPASVNQPQPIVADAFKRGMGLVEKFKIKDPEGALSILQETATLSPKDLSLMPTKIDLLKQVIATNSAKTNRVVELALIYEQYKKTDENVQLLTPYKTRLGDTEGARILGEHLLAEGQYQDAYNLLFPYVQKRLEHLHQVERTYTNAMQSASRHALNNLQNGQAEQAFYNNYKQANKTEKEAMVDEYISHSVERDPTYQHAVAELRSAGKIVNVTLDLGIVQLNRAQNLSDPEARKKELEAAEKTFLAIRSFAGESDEYRLFLGQVYYWLGKSQDGKDLFDQLLASQKRSFQILIRLGETLRDVGEDNAARTLLEEAYQRGSPGKEKYMAAGMRCRTQKDVDDRIAWLEKCDPNELTTQIELNSARGEKALRDGNKPLAAECLLRAIDGYAKQPKDAATLNNCALCYFDLYDATGEISNHDKGLSMMEESISLAPSDSVLIQNLVGTLLTRAAMDLLHDYMKPGILHESATFSMLSHLYDNETESKQVYAKLRVNEHAKKAMVYLDKALLLAPKSQRLYGTALSLQSGFEDLEELRKLEKRFLIAKIDQAEGWKEMLSIYRGEKDKEQLAKMTASIAKYGSLLKTPGVLNDAFAHEIVATKLTYQQEGASVFGAKVDSAQLLADALSAYQQRHSTASRNNLIGAYYFRANDELCRQSTEYAALYERCRHALSGMYFITLLLERGGPLGQKVSQNENVMKAMQLEKESGHNFPTRRDIAEWAEFSKVDPNEAQAIAQVIKNNELIRFRDHLQFELEPMAASYVLEEYWMQKLMGDEKAAQAVYQEALAKGIPLPSL